MKSDPTSHHINLSLPREKFIHILKEAECEDFRVKCGTYNEAVRQKMSGVSDIGISQAVTPWGAWREEKNGLHVLKSTLNNRFIDTELCAPFLTDEEYAATYVDGMEQREGGVTIQLSHMLRKLVRARAQDLLIGLMTQKGNHSANDIVIITPDALSAKSIDDEYCQTIFGELYREFWQADRKNYLIDHLRNHVDLYKISSYGDFVPTTRYVATDCDVELLHQQPTEVEQTIFIDLFTLSTLRAEKVEISGGTTTQNWASCRAWQFFCAQAIINGVPNVMLSTHGVFDSGGHSLSPANSTHDPIITIVYAMWALGFSEDFSIILDVKNPDREKRGAYLTFKLGGVYSKSIQLLDAQMLNHPLGEKPKKQSSISIFESAMIEHRLATKGSEVGDE